MVVAQCLVDIRLFRMTSLKEKRRVVKSLITRLQRSFGLSVAEVGSHDIWGRLVLGMAVVSNQGTHAREVLERAVSWIENNVDGQVIDFQIDIIA
ncbi:MAG: DUF503 domain-containing protein [Bacillota bacterium]|jgi:uncharacterized protein YlxP (DUF503 family)|nr:DUF503 domain-containing protein [Candidatus Fermentithermobacillaceae bacterium]